MGHSITCNFQCTVNLSNGSSPIYGAMTLKGIKGILLSEKEYQAGNGNAVVNIEIFPQTKAGERYLKGYDFMIMDNTEKLDYYNIGQPIPFYTF